MEEMRCNNCFKDKKRNSFSSPKEQDPQNAICRDCEEKEAILECINCGLMKRGKYFSAYAREGLEDLTCNTCKYQFKEKHSKVKADMVFKNACLKCDKEFKANGKFNKLCSYCKTKNAELAETYNLAL